MIGGNGICFHYLLCILRYHRSVVLVAKRRVLVVSVQQFHDELCVGVQGRRARVGRAQRHREVAEGFVVERAAHHHNAFEFMSEADQLLYMFFHKRKIIECALSICRISRRIGLQLTL